MGTNVSIINLDEGKVNIPWTTGNYKTDESTDVWVYEIPMSDFKDFGEYIICPFHNDSWRTLWSLKLVVNDQPGLLNRLVTFFQERKINIVGIDSGNVANGRYHSFSATLDCRRYNSSWLDGNSRERSQNPKLGLNQIIRELTLHFINEIRFIHQKVPDIQLRRVLSLWTLHEDYIQEKIKSVGRVKLESGNNISLPINQIKRRKAWFIEKNDLVDNNEVSLYALINNQASTDILHVYPFFKGKSNMYFVISLRNIPGAIAAMSSIFEENHINVIASKSWTAEDKERTFVWLLIQKIRDVENQNDEPIEKIKRLILSSKKVAIFEPKFPHSHG